jgi:HAD superfamily hydrolase (TIGR01509 family)
MTGGSGEGPRVVDPQAVFFDMDGLLIDSEPLWLEVETEVMGRLGGDWAGADKTCLVGGSMERTVAYMLKLAERPVAPAQVAEWLLDGMTTRVRRAAANGGVRVMPGATELLAELTSRGVPRALVTSSDRRVMEEILTGIGAADGRVFATTVCAQDVRRTKPDPEPYLTAARRLGVDPARCVVLEDSINGVVAGEAAGCVTVAVPAVAPVPAAPGRTVVSSLREVDLTVLGALVGAALP